MARVVLAHAGQECDAMESPLRGGFQLGPGWLASEAERLGHEAHYRDFSVYNGSWERRRLFTRTLRPGSRVIEETPLDMTWDELQIMKMTDFHDLDPAEYVRKHCALKADGSLVRTMVQVGMTEEESVEHLADMKPDVVGIPLAPSANYLTATRLGKAIKARIPQVKVVMGGQHITADPEGFVRDNPWVDHVSHSDAITTFGDMIAGRYLTKIVPGGFQSMDAHPQLNYRFWRDAGYPRTPTHNYNSGLRSVDVMFSRGCYRDCAFCFAGRKEQAVTQSALDRIGSLLDHLQEMGVREVVVQDDAVLAYYGRFFKQVMHLMKERGLSWSDNGGVEFESFTAEVADDIIAYNASGTGRCQSLYIPFNPRAWNAEKTASKDMVKRYHRNLENLARVRQAGVYVFTSLITGTPDQTWESYLEDLAFLRGMIQDGYLDAALPLSATILPGTEWHTRCSGLILHPDDWAGYNLFTAHYRAPHMTFEQVTEASVRMVKELFDVQHAGPWQTAYADSWRVTL